MRRLASSLIAIVLVSVSVRAQDGTGWTVTLQADASSSYIYAGFPFNGACVQPCVDFFYLSEKGFWAEGGLWGSISFQDELTDRLHLKGTYKEYEPYCLIGLGSFFLYGVTYFGTYEDETYTSGTVSLGYAGSETFHLGLYLGANFGERGSNDEGSSSVKPVITANYKFNAGPVELKPQIMAFPLGYDFGDGYNREDFCITELGLTSSYDIPLSEKFSMPVKLHALYNPAFKFATGLIAIGIKYEF